MSHTHDELEEERPERKDTAQGHGPNWSDLLSSIVVFLVALPLCIGIAVAVGVSPGPALITGIIGGIVVGALSGSPLQVSGPAAGLFVIVADLIRERRDIYFERQQVDLASLSEQARAALEHEATRSALLALGVVTMLAGLMQLVAGRLRLGQWFRAVSPAVVQGMLAGIGVLILASQFHVMLDHKPTYRGDEAHGGLEHLAGIPDAIMKCYAEQNGRTHRLAAITGILTIAVIVLWQRLAPRRVRLIPGALVAVVLATIFAALAGLPVVRLEVSSNILQDVTLPTSASWSLLVDSGIIGAAVVMALIASAETLLCATAVDQMHTGPRTDYDRELSAQGVGNMLCGFLGALPMTGVIVRSSANVHAGAKTRLSTMLHGTWLLVFVVLLPWVLSYIPKAALGAILVYTGYKLVNLKAARKLLSYGKSELAIYVITASIIVIEDLLVGVMVGIGLSAIKLLYVFSHLVTRLVRWTDSNNATLHLEGAATFVRLPMLAQALKQVPYDAELHIELDKLTYIDHACLELLMDRAKQMENTGGRLVLDWDMLHGKFHSGRKRTSGNGEVDNGSRSVA